MSSGYEQVANLHDRYARAADTRDLIALRSLFEPGAVIDSLRGRRTLDEFLEVAAAPPRFEATMHFFSAPSIELDESAGTARMESYAVAYQLAGPGGEESDKTLGLRYVEQVVRTADGWVIREQVVRKLWSR